MNFLQPRMNSNQHEKDFPLILARGQGWVRSRLLLMAMPFGGSNSPSAAGAVFQFVNIREICVANV